MYARDSLVCDQRQQDAKPGSQGSMFVNIEVTHQSGLGTEGVRRRWSRHHRVYHREKVREYEAI